MLKLYAVRDVKADAYGNLLCVPTVGLATRGFQDACLDARSPMQQYPEDYSLYEMGTYDPSSGVVTGLAAPVFIVSAVEVMSRKKTVVTEEVESK